MYGVYSIYDKLSGEYSDLRLFKNEELAKRYFRSVCKGCRFADELQLFKMCDYDTEKGLFNDVLNHSTFNTCILFKPVFIEGGVISE